MKRLLCLLVLFVACSIVGAQDRKPDKKVNVIFCTWTNCGPCQRMKKDTLSSPAVIYRANVTTVEWSTQPEKCRELGVTSFPTYFVVDDSGKIMQRGGGYKNATDFLAWLE